MLNSLLATPRVPQAVDHMRSAIGHRANDVHEKRVKPLTESHDSDAQLRQGQAPARFWPAVNGDPDPATHIAPPSIMQITISRLLHDKNPDPKEPPDQTEQIHSPSLTVPAAKSVQPKASASHHPPEENVARKSVLSTLP
jgi:hypothetical protein